MRPPVKRVTWVQLRIRPDVGEVITQSFYKRTIGQQMKSVGLIHPVESLVILGRKGGSGSVREGGRLHR